MPYPEKPIEDTPRQNKIKGRKRFAKLYCIYFTITKVNNIFRYAEQFVI